MIGDGTNPSHARVCERRPQLPLQPPATRLRDVIDNLPGLMGRASMRSAGRRGWMNAPARASSTP